MEEFNFFLNCNGYNYHMAELYKKASGIAPLQKAKAKQLLNAKAKDIFEKNSAKAV